MNQAPFPKPPPADPLPLEVWLDRMDRAEVGREPFFRGRDREFDVFRKAANSLHAGQTGGGTMIFQGAPGAGKSALMGECMEAVRRHSTPEAPWVAVSVNPGSLQSPVYVVEAMVSAANAESERLRGITSGTIGAKALDEFLDLGRSLYRELSQRGGGASHSPLEGESKKSSRGRRLIRWGDGTPRSCVSPPACWLRYVLIPLFLPYQRTAARNIRLFSPTACG